MKLYVAVLLMTIGISCAAIINNNGRPGCKTESEMATRNYRNIWDPTAYWRCETQGEAAGRVRCPDGLAWVDSKKSCIEWDQWEWETPVNPPSTP